MNILTQKVNRQFFLNYEYIYFRIYGTHMIYAYLFQDIRNSLRELLLLNYFILITRYIKKIK